MEATITIPDTLPSHRIKQRILAFEESLRFEAELSTTTNCIENTITIPAEEWESLLETLFVLQNPSSMEQIAKSTKTYQQETGYIPSAEELNAID